jgi:hypothetical protein
MPKNVCDKCKQVKIVQLCADDLLCHECDLENERQLTTIRGQESAGQSTMAAVGSTHDALAKEQSGKFSRPSSAEVPMEMFAGCTSDTQGCTKPHGCMVFSELLAYVNHYRDNSSVEKLRSTVLNFYSAAEITDAKNKLISVFNQALPSDCPFRTERRKSSARAAQDA